ncbi:hypothetical protein CGCTS75_v012305 [Colletotrichum tropicale]|nr:hypothetical protein CGCTS75_v012305 [Colletotrichum tropicale]
MPKGPPCHRCSTRSLSCTFVQGPGERKRRRVSSPVEAAIISPSNFWEHAHQDFPIPDFFNLTENDLLAGDIEQVHDSLLLAGNPVASAGIETPSQTSSRDNDSSQASPESNFEHSRPRESQQGVLNHSAAESESRPLQRSLEAIPGAFSFFIGPTGAADVHLLSREQYDGHDIARPRLSDGEDEMYGIGAVYLCYIITHMTLFRALLRPLDRWPAIALQSPNEAEGLFNAAKAVIKGSILCVKEFVEMLENMTGSQWNGFWHSWSRQNFAIGGSFMVHLLHITSASNARTSSMDYEVEMRDSGICNRRSRRKGSG